MLTLSVLVNIEGHGAYVGPLRASEERTSTDQRWEQSPLVATYPASW